LETYEKSKIGLMKCATTIKPKRKAPR